MAVHVSAPVLIRICPDCRRGALRPVFGGRGKMGRCGKCGYTGPLRRERDDD